MANLLIVEDNELILNSFDYHFRDVGWNVRLARNGKEAITALEECGTFFHGVILDKNMPGATGDQVVRWMFERELLEDICVVVLTGYPEINSAIDTLRMGAWQYLLKDMKPSEVQTFIAPGIARKLLHRIRRNMWLEDELGAVLARIEEIVKDTVAADGFHIIFLSENLSVTRDFADGSEPSLKEREFVKRILAGSRVVSSHTRSETLNLQPVLPLAGALMAVPVHGENEILGVVAMESLRDNAFDPRWLDVLQYISETISLSCLLSEQVTIRAKGMAEGLILAHREMRHRIVNSLGIIRQSAEELNREQLSEAALQRVGFIQAHRQRISAVLKDLETITEPRDLHMKQVAVASLVRTVVQELGADAAPDTKLILLDPASIAVVLADKDALYDSLICLARNGLEAVDARRVYDGLQAQSQVTLQQEVLDGDLNQPYFVTFEILDLGGHAEIRVKDNGIGFGVNVKERLFNPLFSTKRRIGNPENRGIGLFSSRRVITEMGGTLEGDSDGPYQGATFVITLPSLN